MSTENTEQNESIEQTGNKKLTKNGKIVLGVILSLVLIASILLIVLVLVPEVKEERERREYEALQSVEIRVVNPNTGEYLQDGDTLVLGEEKTKIEVEFYDIETGERITDIPGYRFEDCYTVTVQIDWSDNTTTMDSSGYWPQKTAAHYWYEGYHIYVRFTPRPPVTYNHQDENGQYKLTVKSWDFNVIFN